MPSIRIVVLAEVQIHIKMDYSVNQGHSMIHFSLMVEGLAGVGEGDCCFPHDRKGGGLDIFLFSTWRNDLYSP